MKRFLIEIREDEIKDVRRDLEREGMDVGEIREDDAIVEMALPFDARVSTAYPVKENAGAMCITWGVLFVLILAMAITATYWVGWNKGYDAKTCGLAQCMSHVIKYSR